MGKHIGNPLRIWKNILGRFGHFPVLFSQEKHRFLQILSKFINNSPVVGVGSFPHQNPPKRPGKYQNKPDLGGFPFTPVRFRGTGKHENVHFLTRIGCFLRKPTSNLILPGNLKIQKSLWAPMSQIHVSILGTRKKHENGHFLTQIWLFPAEITAKLNSSWKS